MHEDRICTDIFCTVFSITFSIFMLIIAIITFDINKLSRSTYPTDIEGRLCTYDNREYNYLYFTSLNDPVTYFLFIIRQNAYVYQNVHKVLRSH